MLDKLYTVESLRPINRFASLMRPPTRRSGGDRTFFARGQIDSARVAHSVGVFLRSGATSPDRQRFAEAYGTARLCYGRHALDHLVRETAMRQLCRFSIVAFLVVLSGCASQPPKANTTHADVAHIGAVTYHVRDSGDATPDEHPSGIGVSGPPSCTKWGTETGELFHGCARRAAKVSLVPLQDAAAERYQTVVDLKQNLIDDDTMRHHTPPITEAADSERESDEQRNVVLDAVVYAFKAEDDRDFHLIVGDPGCDNSKCFMNVEVSALPKDAGSD